MPAMVVVRSIQNVVMAIRTAATSVTVRFSSSRIAGVSAGPGRKTCETTTRPISNPRANPKERMFNARDSGTPCAIRCCASQFHTPTSQATYKNSIRESNNSEGFPSTAPAPENTKPAPPAGAGIGVARWITSVAAASDAVR